jgi:hypothetical protein
VSVAFFFEKRSATTRRSKKKKASPLLKLHQNSLGDSNIRLTVSPLSSAFIVTTSSPPAHFKTFCRLASDIPMDMLRSHR